MPHAQSPFQQFVWKLLRSATEKLLWFIVSLLVAQMTLDRLAKLYHWLQPYRWQLAILSAISIAIVGQRLWNLWDKHRPRFPRVDCDFEIIDKRIVFHYESREKVRYVRHYKLRALKDNLLGFPDTYRWTGSGKCIIRSGRSDQEIVSEPSRNEWNGFVVKFYSPPKRGTEISCEVIWELDDVAGTAVPFISATINEPTRRLVLEVHLASGLDVTKVSCQHRSRSCARKAYDVSELALEEGRGNWIVDNPRLLHHYEMNWKRGPSATI